MFKEAAQKAQGTSPAYQLAQNPVFNNRDGAKLYDALSRQLDAQAMTTIDNYYARQVGDKLKGRGMKHPSDSLTQGLARAWLGRRPEGDMLDAVLHYPDSKQVLEELLDLRPGLGNMATADLKWMINYQHRLTEDDTLSPEDRARAMNRLGIYEKEALYGRGMTKEEVEGLKTSGPENLLMTAEEEEPRIEKFSNKIEGEDVPYSETLIHPKMHVSPNGEEKYDGYVFPLKDTTSENRYGGAEAEEKIPLWYFVGAIHQSVDGEWKYNHSMGYGQADCIGVARLMVQQYYKNKKTMNKHMRAKVSRIFDDFVTECTPIDPNNMDEIPVGAVLFRKSGKGHMGYYLGEFDGRSHCIAETNHKGDVMHYDDLESRYSEKEDEGFYYWAKLKCVDYETDYAEDPSDYLVVDEPEEIHVWEEWDPHTP